jgi:hypothetical protein
MLSGGFVPKGNFAWGNKQASKNECGINED